MSLIIKNEDSLQYSPIRVPLCKDQWEVRSLDSIPQQIRDCPPRARIVISEYSHSYTLNFTLPGVELRNLWVCIEGRILTLYAGVTGEKREEDGVYRYTEKLLGGIKGEITLPERVHQKPEKAMLIPDALILIFPKEVDESFWDAWRLDKKIQKLCL